MSSQLRANSIPVQPKHVIDLTSHERGSAEDKMPSEITEALERSRSNPMSADELEAQRRSFAYGNGKIEYDSITREMVNEVADAMACRGVAK